jgi:hypothetical protein
MRSVVLVVLGLAVGASAVIKVGGERDLLQKCCVRPNPKDTNPFPLLSPFHTQPTTLFDLEIKPSP